MTGLRGRCSSSTRGRMVQSKPERSEGFDAIIHPAPIITRNSQIRHIFTEIRTAYSTQWTAAAAILFLKIQWALSPPPPPPPPPPPVI